MARAKTWSDEDREHALEWVANKAKTGAVFRDQAGTADDMLPALAAIEDPAGFAIALQEALTTAAWKRLLGALRQRKHQAQQVEDDAPGQQAEDPSCDTVRRFTDAVYALDDALSALTRTGDVLRLRQQAMQRAAAHGKQTCLLGSRGSIELDASGRELVITADPALSTRDAASDDGEVLRRHGAVRLRVIVDPVIDVRHWINHQGAGLGSGEPQPDTWQHCGAAIVDAVAASAREMAACHHVVSGDTRQVDLEPVRSLRAIVASWQADDDGQVHHAGRQDSEDQVEAKAYQVAAIALACTAMAAGKSETEAARITAGRLRDVQRERGEERDIGTAHVQQWLRRAGGQRLAPASADIRDAAIVIMDQTGESKRAIARALNISDGTVRNVLKRQQVEAA